MARETLNQIRDYVLRGVESGAFAHGQKLPAERDLALRFGTTRATVRQALVILESEMRVTRHVGRGTFIAGATGTGRQANGHSVNAAALPLLTGREGTSPAQLMEARQLLEPHLAELVVINATPQDLSRIRAICQDQRSGDDFATFEASDIAFHRAIAEATHNELVIAIADLILQARRNPEWQKLKQSVSGRNRERRASAIREHQKIVEALDARNAAAAAGAMRKHLHQVRFNLLGY
ncbi:MAG: FCD domain-containing protein [Azospirillaceae bacterium]